MRGILFLSIILTLYQEIESKEKSEAIGVLGSEVTDVEYHFQKHSISDAWNNIKNTANLTWVYIKSLTKNYKKSIAACIEKIKVKAQDLGKAFEQRLNEIKDHINGLINKIMKTGDIVKKCLEQRKQEIDEILRSIVFDVTNCISNSITHLDNLAAIQYEPCGNETYFFQIIYKNLNVCLNKSRHNNEFEECIQNIRKGIYENVEMTEEKILQNHTETRNATDDLLNVIVGCTTDGVIKSTAVIVNETVHIIECVTKG